MRNSSIVACCAILSALPAKVSAQSFEDRVQSTLDAERVGSSLSRKLNFGTGEAAKRHGAFDKPPPEFHLETEADPEVAWFNPSIEIAGAKVSPDVKRKGLKVRIPMDLSGSGVDGNTSDTSDDDD
ncbi:hypothetical protein [Aureimonas leprariae]|uniref:Uncharacterized protein n=1 Tax=Plantimonas leprariae TaxID=2615207 RepID=A0A7V7TW59_9HYPH|nr:hypothetical protein [Aureimonas leprariae]KAB0679618.1 hypothetical protein F6X38_12405 [Aureimonas leprariae]